MISDLVELTAYLNGNDSQGVDLINDILLELNEGAVKVVSYANAGERAVTGLFYATIWEVQESWL